MLTLIGNILTLIGLVLLLALLCTVIVVLAYGTSWWLMGPFFLWVYADDRNAHWLEVTLKALAVILCLIFGSSLIAAIIYLGSY